MTSPSSSGTTYVTEVDEGSTLTFTMQSRDQRGQALEVGDDIYTVLLVRLYQEAEKKKSRVAWYSGTGTHQGSGLYTSDITIDKKGVYTVIVNMENAITAEEGPSTSIGVYTGSLIVTKEPKSKMSDSDTSTDGDEY